MRRALFVISLLSSAPIAAFIAGCPGSIDDPSRFQQMPGTDGGTTGTGTCAAGLIVETDIFQMKCNTAACHEGPMSSSGLDLTTTGVKKRLLNRPSSCGLTRTVVTVSAPDMSVILDRLSAAGQCGPRMPLARTPLSAPEIDCVKTWVQNAVKSSTVGM